MPRTRRTRREIVEMAVISLGFAIGVMLIVWGVSGAVTGREAFGVPDQIDTLSPEPGENQVTSRSEVFVDLEAGYGAELIVDGLALETTVIGQSTVAPGTQVELPPTAIYDPGNFSIRFQPQEGAPIEEWGLGTHTVTVRFWDLEEGEGSARLFSWSFEVL